MASFSTATLLAQRSTRITTQNVSHVERRYEPLVRLARDLERAVGAFDRAVLGSLKFDASPMAARKSALASRELLLALADYQRIGEPVGDGDAARQVRYARTSKHFTANGFALIERQKERQVGDQRLPGPR